MFVDGVAVVQVAQDQRIDGVNLGENRREQLQGMHGAQRISGVPLQKQFAQVLPCARVLRHGVTQGVPRVGKPALGFEAELGSVPRHEGEELQDHLGIAGCSPILQGDLSIDHRELFVRGPRLPTPHPGIQG